MALLSRQLGNPQGESIVFVSGFGDNGSLYEALAQTPLAKNYSLIVTDLPGFGDADPELQPLNLDRTAELIAGLIDAADAGIVVGHSLGSVTVSLAAARTKPQVHTIISIEGNLTPEDAYFSGSAVQYGSADEFRTAFLSRLDDMAAESPVVSRYRQQVAKADPQSLWELGCDAHEFSAAHSLGDVLSNAAPRVHYLYNPANTPAATLRWLEKHQLPRTLIPGAASHWIMVDQPHLLAGLILDILDEPTLPVG